jgi:hypothetical protein
MIFSPIRAHNSCITMARTRESFEYHPVEVEGRLLIESVCVRCGASRIVSGTDGTLEEWLATHECKGARAVPLVVEREEPH